MSIVARVVCYCLTSTCNAGFETNNVIRNTIEIQNGNGSVLTDKHYAVTLHFSLSENILNFIKTLNSVLCFDKV